MAEVMDKSVLEALSTETRREIVKLLAKRPYTASELSAAMKKHVTTVTEHLNVLEKSGLVRRKESKNKWVYYALTDKGERIFKPTYYSWIIILSLSMLCLLVGTQQIMSPGLYGGFAAQNSELFGAMTETTQAIKQISEESEAVASETANESMANETTTTEKSEPVATSYSFALIRIIIGSALIIIALIGFSYLIIKRLRRSTKD